MGKGPCSERVFLFVLFHSLLYKIGSSILCFSFYNSMSTLRFVCWGLLLTAWTKVIDYPWMTDSSIYWCIILLWWPKMRKFHIYIGSNKPFSIFSPHYWIINSYNWEFKFNYQLGKPTLQSLWNLHFKPSYDWDRRTFRSSCSVPITRLSQQSMDKKWLQVLKVASCDEQQ